MKKIREYREKNMNIVYIDETWIDTSYTVKYCWQSKDERDALLPISRDFTMLRNSETLPSNLMSFLNSRAI
jgi:hypothetical protein